MNVYITFYKVRSRSVKNGYVQLLTLTNKRSLTVHESQII